MRRRQFLATLPAAATLPLVMPTGTQSPPRQWTPFLPDPLDPWMLQKTPEYIHADDSGRVRLMRKLEAQLKDKRFYKTGSGLVCYRKNRFVMDPVVDHGFGVTEQGGTYVPFGGGLGVDPVTLAETGARYPEREFPPFKVIPPEDRPRFTVIPN